VNTATDGTYAITGISAGSGYTIEVSLSFYTTGTIASFNVSGNAGGKDLILEKITVPTYTITGTITLNDLPGPAGGATVQLKEGAANISSPAITGVSGNYTITGAPAGTYTIEVSKSGYNSGSIAAFAVSGDVGGKDLMLTAQGAPSGISPPPVAGSTTYTVTFNSQGGSFVASQTVTEGCTVPYPAEPTKADVFFDGWYKESGCSNPCDYGAPVTGPITLYAKWLSESEMITGEFGASVPEIFEVNNNTAAAPGQPEWDTSWVKARTAIDNGGNGKNYIIKVTGNFTLAGVSSNTFTPGNIKVLIYAPTSRTISLSGNGSLLRVGANQTLILRNITLQGRGSATSNTGSLIYCNDINTHLVMRPGTVIKDNSKEGVYVDSGTFTMSGGTISGNSTSPSGSFGTASFGGGVYVDSGTFTMSGGTISGNLAISYYIYSTASFGGGVYVDSGTFTMSGGTISDNSALGNESGGCNGVYVSGGTFTMNGGIISSDNSVGAGRSGVYVSGGTFTMNGGTISDNLSSGVYVSGGTFTMDGGTISDNSAGQPGGGVFVDGTFTMNGGTISNNSAPVRGGVGVDGTFTMNDGTISGNWANGADGIGAIGFAGGVGVDGTFTMSGGTISGNWANGFGGLGTASGLGGGVGVVGTFTMSGGTISGNSVNGLGGGVALSGGTFTMSGGTIYGSRAGTGLENTALRGASLAFDIYYNKIASTAKYGNGSDIIASGGLATDETLAGHN
jgi:uncharacterized repeat protein (TIGR02543 family)